MAWSSLSNVNQRGTVAAIVVAMVLIVVETMVDAPVALNAARMLLRAFSAPGA